MHDSIRNLGQARTLDDLMAETEQLAADGAAEGRDRFVGINERGDDETRRVLRTRLGAEGLAHVIHGGAVDSQQGRRIAALPTRSTAGGRAARSDDAGYTGLAEGVVDVDDHATTPDEYLDLEEQRRRKRTGESAEGGVYDGMAECAAGTRVSGPKRNDKGPRSRRKDVGESIDDEHWESRRGGRPRKGRDVRERFSVRAEPATRAAIAETGRTESDFLAEAAKLVAMARTGAQADELMRAVIALAGDQSTADVAA